MKRSLPRLRNVVLFVCNAALAATTSAFSDAEWKFQQAFSVESSGVLRIAVPVETLDRALPDLRDLRIVGADGTEVPFALVRPSSAPARWRPAARFAVALQEGATVITISAEETKTWEAVDLIIGSPSFLKAARLEASTDGKTWQQWEDGVPIFRKDGAEQTTLALGREPARYFRVTLNDHRQNPIIVTGARLREPASEEVSLDPFGIQIARTDEYASETALTLNLPGAHFDLDSLEVIATDGLFTRRVRVGLRQFHEGEIEERNLAADTIFRLKLDDSPPAEKTRVIVAAAVPSRELVLHIDNGDSPPLHVEQIKGVRRIVYVAFEARSVGRYTLWSGNGQASAPHYDLATITDSLRRLPPTKPGFEPTVANPNYHHADPLAGLSLAGSAVKLTDWSNRRAVKIDTAGVQLLELDLAALSNAQRSLSDVRLVNGDKQVPYILERTQLSRRVDLQATTDADTQAPNSSRWRVRLPYAAAPVTQLVLATSAALFQREVHVFERRQTGNGETYEAELGRATWQRTPQDVPTPLAIPLSPPQTSQFWIQMDNGDNPPISLDKVGAYHPVSRLLFRTESIEGITLLSGNLQAASPRYDLSLVAQTLLSSEKQTARLAPANTVESTDAAGATLPVKTALFWGALALVVVALLAVVAKLLPKPPSPK